MVLFMIAFMIQAMHTGAKPECTDGEILLLAVKAGDSERAAKYIKEGMNVNFHDTEGITPLYCAVRNGNQFIADLLLKNGASIQAVTKTGYTILHAASFSGLISIVRQCLGNKPDINARDTWCGWTPIHLASKQGRTQIIRLLVNAGADINIRDHSGASPLHLAAMANRTLVGKLLIENRADINSRDKMGRTPLYIAAKWKQTDFVRFLLKKGVEVNMADEDGITPLLVAADQGQGEIAELIIAGHADISIKTKNNSTLIHAAINGGLLNLVKKCLDWDLDVNAKEQGGWSPLHAACQTGNRVIAELLINKGAVINAETWEDIIINHRIYPRGTTPFRVAKILNNQSVIELLTKYIIEE
jgi:ankyrin repeat protein